MVLAFFSWAYTQRLHTPPEILAHPPIVLFPIARTQNQPGCSSTDEWIMKMWYLGKVDSYTTIKKNVNGRKTEGSGKYNIK